MYTTLFPMHERFYKGCFVMWEFHIWLINLLALEIVKLDVILVKMIGVKDLRGTIISFLGYILNLYLLRIRTRQFKNRLVRPYKSNLSFYRLSLHEILHFPGFTFGPIPSVQAIRKRIVSKVWSILSHDISWEPNISKYWTKHYASDSCLTSWSEQPWPSFK